MVWLWCDEELLVEGGVVLCSCVFQGVLRKKRTLSGAELELV